MTGDRIYVSHAPDDLELVRELFTTVRNLPVEVTVALEAADGGPSRTRLAGRLTASDVVIAVLTRGGADSPWINQEIGYALAEGIPVVPLYDDEQLCGGFLHDAEGVAIDREDPSVTIFDLLGRLRRVLAPLGGLSVPNWFVRFPCTTDDCDEPVTLEIEHDQETLWRLYRHGKHLSATCSGCETSYYFDPATLGYVRCERPSP